MAGKGVFRDIRKEVKEGEIGPIWMAARICKKKEEPRREVNVIKELGNRDVCYSVLISLFSGLPFATIFPKFN